MTPLETLNLVKQGEHHRTVSHGLKSQINFRFRKGKPAAERMRRPPLRNTGIVKKVDSAVSNDRRHTVCYLAEIRG